MNWTFFTDSPDKSSTGPFWVSDLAKATMQILHSKSCFQVLNHRNVANSNFNTNQRNPMYETKKYKLIYLIFICPKLSLQLKAGVYIRNNCDRAVLLYTHMITWWFIPLKSTRISIDNNCALYLNSIKPFCFPLIQNAKLASSKCFLL